MTFRYYSNVRATVKCFPRIFAANFSCPDKMLQFRCEKAAFAVHFIPDMRSEGLQCQCNLSSALTCHPSSGIGALLDQQEA